MNRILVAVLLFAALAHAVGQESKPAPVRAEPFRLGEKVLPLLESHCFTCHNADERKGDVRLDNLETLTLDARLELLNRVQEQIYTGEMPPKKRKQPTEDERKLVVDWIGKELQKHSASKLEDKLRKPEYGNVVDHDKLFSGQYKNLPGSTPDRRWLISEFIFDAKFNKLFDYTSASATLIGKRKQVIGDNNRNGVRVNLTNPFLLPTHSGVRYYDTTVAGWRASA